MPRYFFHLASESGLIGDDEGCDLPSIDAARQAALEAARDLAAQAVRRGNDGPWKAVVVTDEVGTRLLDLPLEDALPPRFQCD
jgi:hypothetical protein